jgi:hypothetical protein
LGGRPDSQARDFGDGFVKIIGKSNFDSETVDDVLICETVRESYAKIIVKALNDRGGEKSTYFYEVKPDDYKLYVWEP